MVANHVQTKDGVVVETRAAACEDCQLGQHGIMMGRLAVSSYVRLLWDRPGVLEVYVDPTAEEKTQKGHPQSRPVYVPPTVTQKPGNGTWMTRGAGAGRGAGGFSDDPSTRREAEEEGG